VVFITDINVLQYSNFCADRLLASDRTDPGVTFRAVSDLNAKELQQFVALVRS
jgi:hypothetical protein